MSATPYAGRERPGLPTADELRARIPGWGVDLDPADRPSVPQELADGVPPSTHWDMPEDQVEPWPRERSVEHARLTPVFGTSSPPRALSGILRKAAYARYSEAQAAHWLLLLAADRVDTKEQALRSFVSRRPDNPLTQTGISAEVTRHGLRSRLGSDRVDVRHHAMDPVIVGLPWVLAGWAAVRAVRRVSGRR